MSYNVSNEKITSFTQLRSWQQARQLSVLIYKITMAFPDSERFGLTIQMRKASVSVAANIAEGFSRNTAKDKINFYSMALGSLTETLSHSYIANDLGYLEELALEQICSQVNDLQKMISGLMKSAEGRRIRNT